MSTEFIINPHTRKFYHTLAEAVISAAKKAYPTQELSVDEIQHLFTEAPEFEMGHLSFPCFLLSKKLRQGPPQIAKSLEQHFATYAWANKVQAQGPYLNFFFTPEGLGQHVLYPQLMGENFDHPLVLGAEQTMLEYFQPNTHKEYHVGHMRNLCLGHALVGLMKYAGIPIVSTTFPGDVGTHVAKCLWYLKFHNQEPQPQDPSERGAWLGRMYSKGNNLLEDQKGGPEEDKNRAILTSILKELHAKAGPYFELWKTTREYSVFLMEKITQWAHVSFDQWYWESEVDAPSVEFVKKKLAEGKFVIDSGAVGLDLKQEKLGFVLLLKSDGTGLYATKDLELARRKFEDWKVKRSLYLVDNRQDLHFKQVFKTLEKLGFEQAKNCAHISYEMVELPDGAMSSRKGNIVPLMTLIKEMEQKIIDDYLEKNRPTWGDQEIERTAHMVAEGAIKYGMIGVDPNKKIVFDMKEWLRLDGESGPYLQYTHARIHTMVEKLGGLEEFNALNWSMLDHNSELALLSKLIHFNQQALLAATQFRPSILTHYLYQLCKLFNSFYAECPVGKASSEELKLARLALCQGVKVTLAKGLGILGIAAPLRM